MTQTTILPPRILVVEDEGIVAMEIQNRLASMGYRVVALASVGEVAIEKARQLQPDLVLMDIRLKGNIDGVTAAEQIRAQFDIPVIFLTAYADEHTLQRAKVTEPYGYVLKPFEERELHIAMEVALYKHRTEQKLKANERWLATTLNSIGDAVIAMDATGLINFMNHTAEILTGWSLTAASGQDLWQLFQLINERSQTALENPVTQALHKGIMISIGRDTSLITTEGTKLAVEGQAAPIRNEAGQTIGVVLVLRDVIEQRKLEEELLKAQRLESLGLMAGGIAHKFNNLLAVIISNISLIKLRTPKENNIYGKLETVEKTAWKAAEAAQQLLTFAKGGAPIKKICSAVEIITTATELMAKPSNVHYNLLLPSELWSVEVDPGQISQVFTNLLLNAEQAMPNGGTIRIQAENVWPDALATLPLAAGRYLCVSIQDQGSGIPQNVLPHIFEPYFTTKTNADGLGLATAYSIISRHAGHIAVTSKPALGTTFYIYLPASMQEQNTAVLAPVSAPVLGHGKKILIMDDEDLVREGAGSVLGYLGYKAEFVKDGLAAVARYKQAKAMGEAFDVVILDLTVQGGMGGKEAIRQLLELDTQVKAVVSSGYSHDPVMANFRDYGFSGVLAKPYTIEELNNTLAQVIREAPPIYTPQTIEESQAHATL
ncbi:MAG: response regulator [Chloroflexi bacterium]|nr:response regulator [Chloroflexota bacterium]